MVRLDAGGGVEYAIRRESDGKYAGVEDPFDYTPDCLVWTGQVDDALACETRGEAFERAHMLGLAVLDETRSHGDTVWYGLTPGVEVVERAWVNEEDVEEGEE